MSKDATALSLFEIVKENLVTGLELPFEDIAKKLVCIGVDGCSVMQGHRTGLCVRIQTTLAPYALAIHCMAHQMDLTYKIVDTFKCIENVEGLVSCATTFFCRSPKRYLQFQDMSKGLTKGRKLMKIVNTRWISLYFPAKRLLEEYPALVGLMDKLVDEGGDMDKASELLARLTDLETLFTLAGLLPMLNEMNMLVKMASKETMYSSEYTTTRKLCCTTLGCLYSSALDVPYNKDKFLACYKLLDIESDSPKSSLRYNNKGNICMKVHSRLVQMYSPKHRIRGRLIRRAPVPKTDLDSITIKVRENLKEVAAAVSDEIRERFPRDELLEATAVVHPRFWRRNKELETVEEKDRELKRIQEDFKGRLKIISAHFCKTLSQNGMAEINGILNEKKLEEQSICFGATMWAQCKKFSDDEFKKDPTIITKLWTILGNSQVLSERMSEYFRLADLCQTLIPRSVEDEQTFSALGILKNKVRNKLTENLDSSLPIYACKYDDTNFPYENALAIWNSSLNRRNYKERNKSKTSQDLNAAVVMSHEEDLDGWQV